MLAMGSMAPRTRTPGCLQEAQRARIEAENIKAEVQGLANASIEDLLTIPAVLQHQVGCQYIAAIDRAMISFHGNNDTDVDTAATRQY